MEEKEIKIILSGGKKVDAEFNGFVIKTDQPEKDGGNNSAPTPYDFFLSSIGTCAGFYVLSFCQKREIPTEHISLVERIIYGKKNDGKEFLERIVLDITVPPDFPEKYRGALVRVAENCSVKKSVMNPPAFEITTTVRK